MTLPARAAQSSDRMMQLKRALILGSSQHLSCGAAKAMLLWVGRFLEGSREQRGGVRAEQGGAGELKQLTAGEGGQATSSA